MTTDRAAEWRGRGAQFSWRPASGDATPVEIFHVEAGDPAAPTLLLVHGFPTSSIDWWGVMDRFSARFRVCALDFPGYGFSAKPRNWGYSLHRDADLLGYYLDEVIGTEAAVVVAHDRGDSVALIHASRAAQGQTRSRLHHLVLTNGNMFLPLSNLTTFQRLVLDPTTADTVLKSITPAILAAGMGNSTFSPHRTATDPDVEALAETFAHDDGIGVLHETIQYLVERSNDEEQWLSALSASSVPTTVIWGLEDTVSPVRVAAYIWNQYLMRKPGANALYFVPGANHYLQNDRPDALADAVLHALDAPADAEPGAIAAPGTGAPVLVDRSRSQLPTAPEVLRGT